EKKSIIMQQPSNIGILALEIYFPNQYCDQAELEQFDGVSAGKYTIGLGQAQLGFCYPDEDVNSMALTVTQNLLQRNKISTHQIGFLEVGTETLIDKSKSTKTYLMQLFGDNSRIEGVDVKNACFGGTQALFHAVNWLESSYCDGRLALVVCSDIAVYARGPARCTGGAGAVAVLLGPDAPLVFDSRVRALHMAHEFDFYKPDPSSEYATVDGQASVRCYLSALDSCYMLFREQLAKADGTDILSAKQPRYYCFHTPFSRLVQKSFARLAYLDCALRQKHGGPGNGIDKCFAGFESLTLEQSRSSKEFESVCLKASQGQFDEQASPCLLLARRTGNMYTPSVYASLVSCLIGASPSELVGQRIALFSYGSGLAAAMFSVTCTDDPHRLAQLIGSLSHVTGWLDDRKKVTPEEFHRVLQEREEAYAKKPEPYSAESPRFGGLRGGTHYLAGIDSSWRRTYRVWPGQSD
ncbi:hypothetical protein BOX15_Mlig024673g2, partial [Macrostomum lignano]